MNYHFFMVIFFILAWTACSDQKQTPTQIKFQDNAPWLTYRDAKYPLTFKFPGIPRSANPADRNNVNVDDSNPYDNDDGSISVTVCLEGEFPNFPQLEEFSPNELALEVLLRITFFQPNNPKFKLQNWIRRFDRNSMRERMINNIPVLELTRKDENYEEKKFIAIIPGYGMIIEPYGLSPLKSIHEADPKAYDRIIELTRKTLESLAWEEPIDQNSKELKDWKARILALIQESLKE